MSGPLPKALNPFLMREVTGIPVVVMAMHVPRNTSEEEGMKDMAVTGSSLPPLAALLACREVCSSVMEHEKAILVMKEHDYAKAPELTQLAPFLRRLTEDEQKHSPDISSNENRRQREDSELYSVRQSLAEVRLNLLLGESSTSTHLKNMVTLQAALIHELQEQIYFKDVETNKVRREKEQVIIT